MPVEPCRRIVPGVIVCDRVSKLGNKCEEGLRRQVDLLAVRPVPSMVPDEAGVAYWQQNDMQVALLRTSEDGRLAIQAHGILDRRQVSGHSRGESAGIGTNVGILRIG